MEVNIDQTRWYDRLLASFIFYTRLPLRRWRQPPRTCYQAVVEHWPLTGWLTGGLMGATLYAGSLVLPAAVAVLLAMAVRLLVTGALHEVGLARFVDGLGGGGGDRQRTLDIMGDPRIGTYGTVGLVCYLALLFAALCSLPPQTAALTIAAADPFSKMVSSQLILMMPCARAGAGRNGVVFRKPSAQAGIGLAVQGLLPLILFVWLEPAAGDWSVLVFLPALTMYFLYRLIWQRLRGYTNDCCGAVCLLAELTFCLVVCSRYYL
ncbi:MAG: adenosylcobinamide-GDP ribazoletransferase [Prevotella sp.]|nr:adenosylcobinamide-GDP ribazoletransferase [Prevotella sp.]